MKVDCAIIGGGIVGLSVGTMLLRKQPGLRLVVLEKESVLAFHQSGRNSGVIHSGIYYKPGSLKARFAIAGNRSMVDFCVEHGVAHEVCGKVIVATQQSELSGLEALYHRGTENGLNVTRISAEEVKEIEPHVQCLQGIRVPSTGTVDFKQVCATYATLIRQDGGEVRTGAEVGAIRSMSDGHVLETSGGEVETKFLINCGGLQSDRIVRRPGLNPEARIIPFRGEYYDLLPPRRHLVKGLIYPVPDPAFPFLGVHFTRMIDGSVHAGPNAVLAFRREGYRRGDFGFGALAETLTYPGFWKLARRHYKEGCKEMYRSLSKNAFVRSLQRLIPEISVEDVVPTNAGVRAQALRTDGSLVDDFLIVPGPRSLHVCNAPSPAATASLEIGKAVAERVPELRTLVTSC
ncbi:MAG: L-2-hydroxyglutarate oxidase [Chthoniobacterales bacterium]|nr:L-2-hydroxyglutarate oxidase [Chthoniobacterales bacterium]